MTSNLPMNLTFKAIERWCDPDRNNKPLVTYEVRDNGVLVGTVSPVWFRLGGHGWGHSVVDGRYSGTSHETRTAAARSLVIELRRVTACATDVDRYAVAAGGAG